MSEKIEVREGVYTPIRDVTNKQLMEAWLLAKDKQADHEEDARLMFAEMMRRLEETRRSEEEEDDK